MRLCVGEGLEGLFVGPHGNVAYCLRSGRASSAKPTTPGVSRSWAATWRDPRNSRHVDRRRFGGIDDASTRYSCPCSSGANDFHGDFMDRTLVADAPRFHRPPRAPKRVACPALPKRL
jgi:hypothetical protein